MTIADPPKMKLDRSKPGPFTPEDVLALEEEALYELVDGHLVEKSMSTLANYVTFLVSSQFTNYLATSPIARAYLEQTFQCFDHAPEQIRRPDLSVILLSRMQDFPEGHLHLRPDIAVEVLSPNDTVRELRSKLNDYRRAAFPLVWVLLPDERVVQVRLPDGTETELRDGDTLTADPVLPGFSVRVSDLFPPPK